jgi:hypothetical protein
MADLVVVRDGQRPAGRSPLVLVRCADWDVNLTPIPEGAVKLACEWCARPCWCDVVDYTQWTLTAADPSTRRPILCTKCGLISHPGQRSH